MSGIRLLPGIIIPTGEGLPFSSKARQSEHSRAYVTFGATQQTGGKTRQGGIIISRNSLNTRRWRRGSAYGFTLLEVLVALAILAISLGALIKAGTEHTRNTHYLQERTLAHWTGQNLLARYQAGLVAPQRGITEGTLEQAGREWRYQLEIREETPEALLPLPPVLRLEILVWPAQGPEVARARVLGYLLP